MNDELLTTLKDTLAKTVFGSSFKDLHASEASSISEAAHAAFKDVTEWARANPSHFAVEMAGWSKSMPA